MTMTIGIGIGANLGNRYAIVLRAIDALGALVSNIQCSNLYETLAFPDPKEPTFLNAVLIGETNLGPDEVLLQLKRIEGELGRQMRERWASREIDLDLLFYGRVRRSDAHLTLPHAHMHERDCVLAPLAELLPMWRHPVLGRTAQELLVNLPAHAARTIIRGLGERELFPFDPDQVVGALTHDGAISVPLIPDRLRRMLLEEASHGTFIPAEPYAGPHRVVQNLSSATDLAPAGGLMWFKTALATHATNVFASLPESPFESALDFNHLVLQRYEPTVVGVGPHRDFSVDRNLICIAILGGNGKFCLCDNREGHNLRPLDSTPGNVIFMRAPGFRYASERPWHCAVQITTPRMVYNLRQTQA